MKSKETKRNRKEKLREKECQKYYYERMQQANIQLEEGETLVQMIDHNDYYFLTSHGRVFSVFKEECIEKKQYPVTSKNAKRISNGMKQMHVQLQLRDKTSRTLKTSRLVAHYFQVSVFNPMNEDALDCHHIEPYDVKKGNANNHSEKLQMVGTKVHQNILTQFANAEVTPEGTTLEFSSKMFQKLQEIKTDDLFAIARTINADSKACTAVWGDMLTAEQIDVLLHELLVKAAGQMKRINELIDKSKKNPYACTPEEIRELINYSKSMEGETKV